jgi:ectoine hydroxylase-related dioxygenase (phytanoyl-CoA dioxygenase family)
MMSSDWVLQIQDKGFCVLKSQFPTALLNACRDRFWPTLLCYLDTHRDAPNRGPHRHFLPMPFEAPCFCPELFFGDEVLSIVRGAMGDRIVADQWGCDVALRGSVYQNLHVDYQRPLFAEAPDLELPIYMLVVSFGLAAISHESGPIEIVPGSHRLPRKEALRAVETSELGIQPVPLEAGDVLIRHPWALHRGSPNLTDHPRALVSIRFVRRWYADDSREVNSLNRAVWESLTPEQKSLMRFPLGN